MRREMRGKGMLQLMVNGEERDVIARPADTLLHVLREQLQLTGAKPACENGDCDCCTVLMDGWPVKACLVLAPEATGHEITTIEGLHAAPLQTAFADKFAVSCGYCTPGFILNAQALVSRHPQATDEMVDEWLDSNLCRCTGYEEIKEAVKSALVR